MTRTTSSLMAGGETEYNGRVTLAVLGQKVDALAEEIRRRRGETEAAVMARHANLE